MQHNQCTNVRACACDRCRARKLRRACDLVFTLATKATAEDGDALTTLIGVGRFHASTLDGAR
jgi:hypothetical protein